MACKKCGVALGTEQKKGIFTVHDVVIGPYCDKCWPSIKTCTICHQPKEWEKDIQYFDNGMFICDTCKPDHIKICKGCGEESVMNTKDPKSGLCSECFNQVFKCRQCGGYHLNEMRFVDFNSMAGHNTMSMKYPGLYKKYPNNDLCLRCFNEIKHRFKKMKVYKCKRCEAVFNKVSIEPNGNTNTEYCPHCWSHYAFTCGDCSKVTIKTEKTLSVQPNKEADPYRVCSRCSGKYYNCANCNRTHIKKEMPFIKTGKGAHICYTCSTLGQCSKCGKFKKDGQMSPTKNLCKYCYDRTNHCEKCGTRTLETCHHPKINKTLCRKCASGAGLSQLWSWNHKSYPIIHGDPTNLVFGMENEMSYQPKCDHRKVLAKVLAPYPDGLLCALYDSSVFNGFEIVTNPMTYDYFKSVDWGPLFADKNLMSATEVETQNYYNDEKGKFQKWTGFHCHLSKDHFHTHHLYKFMNFIYSNIEFIERVSERKTNEYCANFPNYKEVKQSSKTKMTKKRTGIYMPHRTVTVELRFFAGCHTQEMFHKNIEFIQSLYDFTLDASRESSTKVNDYLAHVIENRERFPHLSTFLGV